MTRFQWIIGLFFCLSVSTGQAQIRLVKELRVAPDLVLGGPRINYMQGKDGFIGLAFNLGWHETNYFPVKHFGFAFGTDFKLSNSLLMAPKATLEYRYYFGVARLGYLHYTDLKGWFENRVSAEIGLSLLSFVEFTYVHTFGSEKNPFNLGNDYFNLTVSIPLIIRNK
ncbi:hypothetical protein D3C87_308760 [compost metagenome]